MADNQNSEWLRTQKREPGKITRAIKVALVGDGTVGKTCLLMSYICQAFMEDYIPTMFDNFSAIEEIDGELVNVIMWDTAGQEDYESIRVTTCFPNTQVFILCFSVVHPDSFHNVKQKWLEELKRSCPDTPYILVGTKIDLRDNEEVIQKLAVKNKQPITTKMGEKKAKEIKAKCYVECSARDIKTVKEVFVKAIRVVMDPLKQQKKKIAELARKEELEELKLQKQVEKQRKKFEEQERKEREKQEAQKRGTQ
jgi:small GTP-binding protein